MKARFSFPNLDGKLGTRKYANCHSLGENFIIMVIVVPLALAIMDDMVISVRHESRCAKGGMKANILGTTVTEISSQPLTAPTVFRNSFLRHNVN